MRSIVCRDFGPLDQLVIEERPSPPCGPAEVRVAVRACGLNFVDGLFVQGRYQIKPPTPFVPGSELAGEITEVGSDVVGLRVGDRVMANIWLGAWTDEAVISADRVALVPERLDLAQAATIGQAYGTAWFSLVDRGALQAGEWLVVLGAGGGVGLAAVDVGRLLGARVIAVASTPEKLALASQRGAEALIDSSREPLKDRIRELTGDGADVVYDPVGGTLAEAGLRGLRDWGRFLVVGFASGSIPSLPANQILLRNRSVVGVDWGRWTLTQPEANAAMSSVILGHLAAGDLDPVHPVTYPFTDVVRALQDFERRAVVGKAVLVP